jgi:hypothetical protein
MKYVALYKTLLLIQKKANGGKARKFDTFFAGLVGGYLVFGDRNAINEQVRSTFGVLWKEKKKRLTYVYLTTIGRPVHLFARNRIIHTPCYLQTPVARGGYEAHPSKLKILLRFRRNRLGSGDVVIRKQGGDNPTGDVQLDDIPLP